MHNLNTTSRLVCIHEQDIDTYIFKKNLLWFILGSGPGGAVGRSAAFGSLEGDARRSREAREDIFDVDHSLRWEGRPGITPKR